jgi:hypothetical protein
MVRRVLALVWLAAATSCSEANGRRPSEGTAGDASFVASSVEIGVPDGSDGLGFRALDDGAELRLQTFGQGGTHVLLAVRCLGFEKRAFVSAKLGNLLTDVEVEEPPPARPQLLYCHDQGICDLVPYLAHTSGLTGSDEEKDGLPVRVTVEVHDGAGAHAETSRDVTLSTADL